MPFAELIRPLGRPWFAWVFGGIIWLTFPEDSCGQSSLFDPSFRIGSGANGLVYAILVQRDGKILVGGQFTEIAGQSQPYLARLNSDGQLDTSFASGTDGPVFRLIEQPDGKILVGGSFSNLQGVARQGIGRILTNGLVDVGFDASPLPGSEKSVFAMGLQQDGKILIGNLATHGELFRLDTNGQLDPSFIETNSFQNYHIFAICPQTNGSILVGGGFMGVNDFSTSGLALLHANGQLDTNYNSGLQTNSNPTTIVEQSDGSLLVGGGMWRQDSTNKMVLIRLSPGLAWDASFHPDIFDRGLSGNNYGYVNSLLLLPNSKILLGGNFQEVGGYWRQSIVRLDSEGRVDPCFDPGLGLPRSYFFGAIALARQRDGKILVGGDFFDLNSDGPNRMHITRLLPQSDCDNMRAYLRLRQDGTFFVAATFPPGGTNILQVSSNLVDWVDRDISTGPYCYGPKDFEGTWRVSEIPRIFVRGKKQD